MVPFVWSPSSERIIPLFDRATAAPKGRVATLLPLRWPDRAAAEALGYSLDAGALLTGPSDTLALTTVTTGDVTLLVPVIAGGVLTLWLTGGAIGKDSLIGVTLSTSSGRRVHRIVRQRIS